MDDDLWELIEPLLPLELGVGSGRTCWRRLNRWHEAGVFEKPHRILLAELYAADALDWSRACVDASHIRAKPSLSSTTSNAWPSGGTTPRLQ